MFFVSQPLTTSPETYKTETQKSIYHLLAELGISFTRVDSDPGLTMEDCVAIAKGLDNPIVKTLFLCNRQKTSFYLLAMPADKAFVTKDFSKALGISRVSFAPIELLEPMLGTQQGATTILSIFHDTDQRIKLVIDEDTLQDEMFACTDSTATCFIKIAKKELLSKYLKHTKHDPIIIKL
jgi:Ala-tRNA(Pro) deacylase